MKKGKLHVFSQNKSYKYKISKEIKSIERLVMETMKQKMENKVFHCNDTAHLKSEICGISKRQVSNLKKSLLQL